MGFSTPDGKGGTLLFPRNAYGIAAGSENKAGAWEFIESALTQDETGVIPELLKEAAPAFSVENDAVISMINEEAAAYYSGQKGLEDVVKVIQNRVQLYVSENS